MAAESTAAIPLAVNPSVWILGLKSRKSRKSAKSTEIHRNPAGIQKCVFADVHDILTYWQKLLSNASGQTGYGMTYVDEKVRLSFSKPFYWLANHIENSTIHRIVYNCCPACICPTEKSGEYSNMVYPLRSHTDYTTGYQNSDIVILKAFGVNNIKNALWSLRNLNPFSPVRANILHNVLLGVLSYLMDWVQDYL